MTTRTVIVFARAPARGRVKTRLAAELGADPALAIYRTMGTATLRMLRTVRGTGLVVQYTPDDAGDAIASWLGHDLRLRPQRDGDLGQRMQGAIEDAFAVGAGQVIVVGTDCPSLTAGIVEGAFTQLLDHDVVFGPAEDGGYYLVGLSRLESSLFSNVPWSAPDTLAVSLDRARAASLRVATLPTLRDVDTRDDWRAWCLARSTSSPHGE